MSAATSGPPAFLHPFAATGQTEFVRLVRGRGSTLYDDRGREYLDAIASLWCVNVGHGRAEVIEAVHDQMQELATYNTFGSWTNEPADRLAELISQRAPMGDARVFFTNSGSESVDTAMKLARLHHVLRGDEQRVTVVARSGGYHGTAYGGTSAQGIAVNRSGFGPLMEDVVHVGRHDLEGMAGVFAQHGAAVAAVIAEPVQGASGVHPPEPGYLEGLRRLCDQHGALLILDEVITGFGRLGSWFASTHFGIEPDLVTFAKAVNSGYVPMGGVIVGPAVRASLEADPAMVLRTGFTYSGHPTAAAAGLACLEVAEKEGLLARATALGDRIGPGLRALHADGLLDDVRGVGAIWAVDLDAGPDGSTRGRSAAEVAAALQDRGVIVRPIAPSTLAMCPPLVMTDREVDVVLDVLAAELGP
jgi:adenosylmethionine-8-amino-7-oxononanoate aminotransferase